MSLAAVPEDGDVPALDDAEVGTVVIEDVCHCLPFAYRLLISTTGSFSTTGHLNHRSSQPRAATGGPAHQSSGHPGPHVTARRLPRCVRPPGPRDAAPGP